jgi:hypothetical protein
MALNSIVERPELPKGVPYRHSLGVIIVLTLMIEFILYAATMSNQLNNSSWMVLWGAIGIVIPFAVTWRLFWLEKHGWWKRRVVQIPDLPVEIRGLDYKATFEKNRIMVHGGPMLGPTREILYANIKRVEPGAKGRVSLVETGRTPVMVGSGSDVFVLIAILAHYAPQAEFRSDFAPMRDGWEPRF